MTNREAIEWIKDMREQNWYIYNCERYHIEALSLAVEALEKQMPNCEDCRHADCVQNNHMIYCLEHSCVMNSDNCCRDWSGEDDE